MLAGNSIKRRLWQREKIREFLRKENLLKMRKELKVLLSLNKNGQISQKKFIRNERSSPANSTKKLNEKKPVNPH